MNKKIFIVCICLSVLIMCFFYGCKSNEKDASQANSTTTEIIQQEERKENLSNIVTNENGETVLNNGTADNSSSNGTSKANTQNAQNHSTVTNSSDSGEVTSLPNNSGNSNNSDKEETTKGAIELPEIDFD